MKFVFIFVALVCANLYFCQAGNTSGNQKVCASPININVQDFMPRKLKQKKQQQQKVCASPCAPININVHGKQGIEGDKGERGDSGAKGDKGTPCNCSLQDPNKPSAHIEAMTDQRDITYRVKTVIKDWSVSAPYSHLAGGMTYSDGRLTVPISGRYYIYAQIYYKSGGRIFVRVNNNIVTMLQPINPGAGEGTLYAGGVFNLKASDNITVQVLPTIKIYMWTLHSYFGAFLI